MFSFTCGLDTTRMTRLENMSQLTGFTLLQEDVGVFIQYKGIEFLACIHFEGAKFNIYGRTAESVNLSDLPSLLEFWDYREMPPHPARNCSHLQT